LKRLNKVLIIAGVFTLFGCNGIPKGVVGDGPIVPLPAERGCDFTADGAVNYMITSLVMKCKPIADAGKDKPKVINDFLFYNKEVDDLQLDVWRKLIKMNMIDAKSKMSESPKYRLHSEIVPIVSENRKGYTWGMHFERIRDKKTLWSEDITVIK